MEIKKREKQAKRNRKPVYVLGIHNSGPISSAALVKDGRLVAAAPEERFSRIKHDRSFPHRAIRFCLEAGGIGLDGVDRIGIGWNPGENVSLKYRAGFSDWMRYPGEWLSSVPNHLLPLLGRKIEGTTSEFRGREEGPFRISYVDHHTCHARLAYEISGFDECAILVADGWSEQKVTTWIYAQKGRFETVRAKDFPQSIGGFYAAITDFLGYRIFSDEWKVMGMAAYGNPRNIPGMSKLIRMLPDGDYELDLSYFDFYNFDRPGYFSGKMELLLGPARKPGEELTRRHFDIAAAAQALYAKVMNWMISHLRKKTGCSDLAFSGGVAMNCLHNGSITEQTGFERCSVSFAPDDSGNSIGAAFSVCTDLGIKVSARENTSSLGIAFTDDQIGEALEKYKLRYRVSKNVARETARLLAAGKVVGWFQGRAEFGQRALGHRSILASPRTKDMKDRLNAAIKYREAYRPFAPVLKLEDVAKFFHRTETDAPVRYMEKALRFRKGTGRLVPAVVHKDGTGRLQTVARKEESLLHGLLTEFTSLTGCEVLVNTSFNLNGEPVVNTPEDALRTFVTSGMDALAMGSCILEKGEG